ncbi:MAG: hypothetical protein A2W31_03155 [Planctomycetes bacterium RBG_16_64_10]|nr:MAG: hypothetical protein A2W31_03155 [Planctomycetes bacterium RBG_16_64_10]
MARPVAERPNIVLILADDLGWSDLACYGSDLHETPGVDRLASEGIRFTDAYAPAPVCTPTRAAILSGEHPARLHMTTWREAAKDPPRGGPVVPPVTVENLPRAKITVAERLHAAGYVTAHLGKWHVGDASHYPETQGFDVAVGGTHWGCPATYFYPYRGLSHGDLRYVPGLGLGRDGDYLTDRLTDEAIRVIETAGTRPFFLYLAYYTVHTPLEAKPALVEHFKARIQPGMRHANATYAAMVRSLDENVERILDLLRQRGIADRTMVIFTADNGGFLGPWRDFPAVTNNAPLRSGKGSLYEGGVRVPLVVRWPKVAETGTACHQPVVLTDLYRTLVEAAGVEVAAGEVCGDGISLVPLLRDVDAALPRDTLYWHYPHYYSTTTPVSALRSHDWKLLEYLEDGRLELYNLRDDLAEQHDLAEQNPAQTAVLRDQLHAWRTNVGAQMPVPRQSTSTKRERVPRT